MLDSSWGEGTLRHRIGARAAIFRGFGRLVRTKLRYFSGKAIAYASPAA
jgi:hypothetical protein